ncbi:PREDICTED: uncharacterized protein LOC109322422 [Crocodylus porosus]|uniref:uncharacterized protein LOC109322422 n=1 Tax=Crocodylus porosus TaxID=8502 RepID=UPI00093C4B50|nr:PREDICTED: uncharacterized protein LOC109322422 [Crocodylus porosus]
MEEVMRTLSGSKTPVSLDMYQSSYMTDYRPYGDYRQSAAHSQKVKSVEAQQDITESAAPLEYQPADNTVDQRRGTTEGPCLKAANGSGDKLKKSHVGNSSGSESFQTVQDQRKYFNSTVSNAESSLPRYYSPTNHKDKLRRTQTPSPLEKVAFYPQSPPTTVQPSGKEEPQGPALCNQEPGHSWDSYQQFIQETCRARQRTAQQNKRRILGSSIFREEHFNIDKRSTYSTDFKQWSGGYDGQCTTHRNVSNIFFQDGCHNQNPWISEYKDNYSIFLKRLNRQSHNSISGLCSPVKPFSHLSHGLSPQKPIAVNMAF